MSEIIAGFIGALIPAIMFATSKWFDYTKLKSEEKRWLGEYLLKLKIDTIRNLQLVMEESYFIYNKYLNISPVSLHDFNKNVRGTSEKFRDAKVLAEIYLNEEQNNIFSNMLGMLRIADRKIFDSATNQTTIGNFDWNSFLSAHSNAVNSIKEILNPKSLREYIKNI